MITKFGTGRLNSGEDRRARLYGVGKFVHTSNCHGQNCTRRAIFGFAIDTITANILVMYYFVCNTVFTRGITVDATCRRATGLIDSRLV